jgi:hypothetical protein
MRRSLKCNLVAPPSAQAYFVRNNLIRDGVIASPLHRSSATAIDDRRASTGIAEMGGFALTPSGFLAAPKWSSI